MDLLKRAERWNLDLDERLNRFIPPSPLHHLPPPVSRFLGYREKQRQDVGNVLGACWSCLGGFCGLAVIAGVFNHISSIQQHHPPALIASFGASAILEYNAIRSPLGQPRNALLGHTLSAIVGVAITKLFRLHSEFERIRWLCGAVACGVSSALMLLTGTVHPPGGASAVLAATLPDIIDMGWYFIPLVMFGTTLMLFVGLMLNNIQRQFPMYWWTPLDLRKIHQKDVETVPDGKGGLEEKITEEQEEEQEEERLHHIYICASNVSLPEDLSLNREEADFLEKMKDRLAKLREQEAEPQSTNSSSTECNLGPIRTERRNSARYFFSVPR